MCFTSSDRSDDPPPRPAQISPQQQSASMPSKVSLPQDFAPPAGPPPSHSQQRLHSQTQPDEYAPPSGPPPSHAHAHEYAAPPGPPPGPRPSHQPAEDYAPPEGPPPGPRPSHQAADEYAPPSGPPPTRRAAEEYAPPSGPPPSHDYAPPTGPPLASNNPFYDDVAPPSGPPPSHRHEGRASSEYAPPLGPPPSQDYAPPPGPPPPPQGQNDKKHDWETAVPDTALLPPPPNFFSGFDRSPANNATEEEAEAGEHWCSQFPLSHPLQVAPPELQAMETGNINMFAPPFFRGTLNRQAVGVWRGQSPSQGTDTCLATYPPLYSVSAHSPIATGRRKTIYYEVHVLQDSRNEVSLALGYTAPPYPPFRLPGWHRGSLGVHGDDGNKYINDRWGGKSFTSPFHRGETLGLGMDFYPIPGGGGINVEVFLTRDGVESGRWNIHEETDLDQDLPVTGLEGFHDICAAVGVFDKVSFEIVYVPDRWRWQGWKSSRYE